ncbi:unnamed protein product [Umbelopsis ramanniana]
MHFDAESEISENHFAENDQSMHHVSNSLLLGSDIGNKSDLSVQWLVAAASGNIAEIRRLVHVGVDVNAKNIDSNTAFHLASWCGHKEVVKALLECCAAFDAPNNFSSTSLHYAAENGHKEIVHLLLNHGASVDSKNNNSESTLHLAAGNGHEEVVNLLLDWRVAVDARNDKSATALHNAAEGGHTEIIQLLLNSSASVDAKDENSNTSLHLAAKNGHKEVVALLLDRRAAVDARDSYYSTALHEAADNGHKEIVQLLLNSSASVDAKDGYSNTSLHLAARMGHKEVVALLLDCRADVDARNDDSATALQLAAKNGHKQVVALLLDGRAAVDARNDDSATALHETAGKGHKEIVQLLLNHGASVDLKDIRSDSPLHLAAEIGCKELVTLLLDCGAAVDAQDRFSFTALHKAAGNGHKEVVALLLDCGADVDARDFFSAVTALQLAAKNGHKEVVALLLDCGVDVDARDCFSATALHLTAKNGYKEVAALLLDCGAAVDARNDDSATALHKAAKNGHKEVVALLLDCGAAVDAQDCFSSTALHKAAEKGHTELVKLLLNSSASVDAKNEYLNTSLHLATWMGHNDVIALLLLYGATTDLMNTKLETALHLAVTSRREQVVKLLLDHGASADLKDINSNTPIQLAVQTRDKYITSQLIANGVNIDEKLKHGKTLLAELSENGDIEMATLLLDHGADKEAVDLNGRTPLIIAVSAAEQSIVSLLIEKGSHIDACDNDLSTALHWSAKDGHFSILKLILQKNANTESKSKDSKTALHIAAELNRTNIVAALIDHKANINAKNGDGKSPIEVAISKGHIEIVNQLKNAGARMGDNGEETLWLLYLAAEAGQVSLIKSTLDQVDEEGKKHYKNATLHEASRHGQVDVVTYLLDNGAEIDSINRVGLTPLFLAGQYPDVISTLIHRGACINARQQEFPHQGVLHYYASLDQIEGVRLLLNCDYNIHIRDNDDDYLTALHYVARRRKGDCEIADILLRQGVDVNAKDRDGRTALHYCSGHDSLDLANLLIDFGIDIDATSFEYGYRPTALQLAIKCRNLELISLLVRHRADVNARDNGKTVLHMAVQKNLTAGCALLIESGANVNSRDSQGLTPLVTALENRNTSLVRLLLEHNASVDPYTLEYIISSYELENDYNMRRRFLDIVNLLVKPGANFNGMKETMAKLEEEYPTLQKLLTNPLLQKLKLTYNVSPNSSIAHEREEYVYGTNDYYSEDESETESVYGDEALIPLEELTSNNINVYEVDPRSKMELDDQWHKYGTGFPRFKRLHLDEDEVLVVGNQEANSIALGTAPSARPLKLFGAISLDERVMNITQSLLNCVGARFFASDHYFMLKLDPCVDVMPPKWASHFDKMQGIVRETGILIVQAPSKRSSLSIPAWYQSSNPYLRFIDAVYTCRRSCLRHLRQEAFSDVLGGSEQKLAVDLHATLIAGLSILSIAGGDGLVEKLVMAIRGVKLDPIQNVSPPNSLRNDWQVRNLRHCSCGTESIHRPLSPVAAAKAVGVDIWRERSDDTVNRVWDLQDDILVVNVDVREVVFITHRWDTSKISPEINYQTVMEKKRCNIHAISLLSTKLGRIRNALKKKSIRYVWIDTICIDKANLSELDEVIRSMYKWYASCFAVVLDSGTPLDTWCSRGWCLQEGAAAGLLCGISEDGNLATIQQLAIEQKQNLCTLDLHLYYQPGNAVEILTRMDVRKTTRKEDMAYALAGIFSIDLTLAYGEGLRSRTRLLEQLAIQKGDLSFLSFHTTQKMLHNSLPAIGERHHLIAKCTTASAPVIVSHFGICFEVQLVKGEDAKRLLQKLEVWSKFSFAEGRFSGVEELIKAGEQPEHQNSSSVEIAIVHNVRSLILVQVYGYDKQTGGGKAIKKCYRLQCCQIEETEFERLLIWHVDESKKFAAVGQEVKRDDSSQAKAETEDKNLKSGPTLERIWLGDKPDGAEPKPFGSKSTERYGSSSQWIS